MKLFDVMVYDTKRMQDVVYRSALPKGKAKKLMKELREKGFKSQLLTARNRVESGMEIEETQVDDSDE